MASLGIGIIGTGSIVNTYVKCIDEIENADTVLVNALANRFHELLKNQEFLRAHAN